MDGDYYYDRVYYPVWSDKNSPRTKSCKKNARESYVYLTAT